MADSPRFSQRFSYEGLFAKNSRMKFDGSFSSLTVSTRMSRGTSEHRRSARSRAICI